MLKSIFNVQPFIISLITVEVSFTITLAPNLALINKIVASSCKSSLVILSAFAIGKQSKTLDKKELKKYYQYY